MPMHLAESRDEAINDVRLGGGRFHREYFEETLGRTSETTPPLEEIIDAQVEDGSWVIGTPDDCIEAIERLDARSGGFGGFLVQAQEWAPRDKVAT